MLRFYKRYFHKYLSLKTLQTETIHSTEEMQMMDVLHTKSLSKNGLIFLKITELL